MRRFWKLRKIFVPQVIALFCVFTIFAVSVTQARAGGGIITKTITDKYGHKVIVKTNSAEFDLGALVAQTSKTETKAVTIATKAKEEAYTDNSFAADLTDNDATIFKLVAKPIEFDSSIHAALKRMNLTPDAIHKWIEQHPKTTLSEVGKMPPTMQAKVANIATFIRSVNGRIDKKTAWREAAAIVHYCAKYNISTEVAVGVAKAESTFNPNIVSKSGAQGVMQIMWKYHAGMLQAKGIAASSEQLSDPEHGIEAGILLLSRYKDAYGSIQKALNRYYGKVSTTYVKKIDNNVAMLEKHSSKTGF